MFSYNIYTVLSPLARAQCYLIFMLYFGAQPFIDSYLYHTNIYNIHTDIHVLKYVCLYFVSICILSVIWIIIFSIFLICIYLFFLFFFGPILKFRLIIGKRKIFELKYKCLSVRLVFDGSSKQVVHVWRKFESDLIKWLN